MSMSGRRTTASTSVVSSARSTSTTRFALSGSRTAIARTSRRAPSRASIAAALSSSSLTTPPPTLPSPSRATPIVRRSLMSSRPLVGVVLGEDQPALRSPAQHQRECALLGDSGRAIRHLARHRRDRRSGFEPERDHLDILEPDVNAARARDPILQIGLDRRPSDHREASLNEDNIEIVLVDLRERADAAALVPLAPLLERRLHRRDDFLRRRR